MPELTREIVRSAPQVTNPMKERELSLRELHLTHLPVTDSHLWQDIIQKFDCVDLSDNMLRWLDAPPLLVESSNLNSTSSQAPPQQKKQKDAAATTTTSSSSDNNNANKVRLSTLILHNNPIKGISRLFASQLSATLTTLALHNNFITDLRDCNVLGEFKNLQRLSLKGNPVQDKTGYRLYVIGQCSPTLKLLDFGKVRDAERKASADLITSGQAAELAATTSSSVVGATGSSTTAADTASSSSSTKALVVSGGRRAARKAAAASGAGAQQQHRPRDATETELLGATGAAGGVGNTSATSISDRVGEAARNKPHPSSAAAAGGASALPKEKRREQLLELLDEAATVEEMDRIQEQLEALDNE